MQKYDWTGVKAKLVYSIPEYLSSNDPNASGISMLNRIIREHFSRETFANVTIEYQVRILGYSVRFYACFLGFLYWDN